MRRVTDGTSASPINESWTANIYSFACPTASGDRERLVAAPSSKVSSRLGHIRIAAPSTQDIASRLIEDKLTVQRHRAPLIHRMQPHLRIALGNHPGSRVEKYPSLLGRAARVSRVAGCRCSQPGCSPAPSPYGSLQSPDPPLRCPTGEHSVAFPNPYRQSGSYSCSLSCVQSPSPP